MNPIAFNIFGLAVRWYGILIATGMLIGILIAKYSSKLRNIDYEEVLNTVLISLPIAVIGARLYYVIFELGYYSAHPAQIIDIRQGGLAIHGGLIAGLTTAFIYTRRKNLNFFRFADAAVPSIILGQALGRWGNFFNGEAHGGPVSASFISHFPEFIQKGMLIGGTYYQPTFLYESIWDICVFFTLLILIKKTKQAGIVFFSYLGLYSIGRFFIEGLRTDSLMLGPIRIAQLMSVLGILAWIIALVFYYKKAKALKEN